MTVLSDLDVLAAMHSGEVVIEPFSRDRLCTSSYDVRLGEWYYAEQEPALRADIFNPYDPEHVRKLWGEPRQADTLGEGSAAAWPLVGFEPGCKIITLEAGQTILGHTEEFIGGRGYHARHGLAPGRDRAAGGVTTMMKARSSMGRCGILVCKCAGWGDVGYINRWTMEITNITKWRVPLLVGSRVAQIVFLRTGPLQSSQYETLGAYQTTADLAKLQATWKPEMMLPRVRP